MFWLVFLIGLIVLFVVVGSWLRRNRSNVAYARSSYGTRIEEKYYGWTWYFSFLVVAVLTWSLPAVIVTGNAYANAASAKNSSTLIVAKTAQRDALAKIVQEELSTEQYAALMAATPETNILVFLGNQASAVLIERAKQIVAFNQTLFALQNTVTQKRIAVCNLRDNPFVPQLPFTIPECEL